MHNYGIRKIEPTDELEHHGIAGMHWGIRRYQYADGSLTPEGRKRYGSLRERVSKWKEDTQRKKAEASEQRKARLIERGSPAEIKRHIREFNGEELESINRRFSAEASVLNTMSKLTGKADTVKVTNVKPAKITVEQVDKFVSTSKNTVQNILQTYNMLASANNLIKEARLPNSATRSTGMLDFITAPNVIGKGN